MLPEVSPRAIIITTSIPAASAARLQPEMLEASHMFASFVITEGQMGDELGIVSHCGQGTRVLIRPIPAISVSKLLVLRKGFEPPLPII